MYTDVQIRFNGNFDFIWLYMYTRKPEVLVLWICGNETSEKFSIEKQHVLYLFSFGTSTYQLSLCYMRLCYEEMDCF